MDTNFADFARLLGLPHFQPGWVWLVGAGPGDPGLITMLGLHAIVHADFILYDALVDETLLKAARPGAGLIFAGKRAGVRSCRQEDISSLLADLARQGHSFSAAAARKRRISLATRSRSGSCPASRRA
jgi:uroporphyrin-III C-methyltransferase